VPKKLFFEEMTMLRFVCVGLISFGAVLGGCRAKGPLLLEKQFNSIQVGQTTSTEVMDLLDREGMLHSANSVSVLSEKGWAKELLVIQFNEKDSRVGRSIYVQMRSRRKGLTTKEMLHLTVKTKLLESVLEGPYENELREKVAFLESIHKLVVSDAREYGKDQQTVSLIGIARSALWMGIVGLKSQPRRVGDLERAGGFSYDHSTLGKVSLSLTNDSEMIYTLAVDASDEVDMVNHW
jgi:hypothetical protein